MFDVFVLYILCLYILYIYIYIYYTIWTNTLLSYISCCYINVHGISFIYIHDQLHLTYYDVVRKIHAIYLVWHTCTHKLNCWRKGKEKNLNSQSRVKLPKPLCAITASRTLHCTVLLLLIREVCTWVGVVLPLGKLGPMHSTMIAFIYWNCPYPSGHITIKLTCVSL